MFTGIIRSTGRVTRVPTPMRLELVAAAPDVFASCVAGDSIAVDGVCLTLAAVPHEGLLAFDVIEETLSKTIIGTWPEGRAVNLEPALRVGDALGGHFVQGHVDNVATVIDVRASDTRHDITFELPEEAAVFCIDRGSITVNGVSLTIMHLEENRVGISLIPETLARTALAQLAVGSSVHVEVDMLARHVAQLLVRAIPR